MKGSNFELREGERAAGAGRECIEVGLSRLVKLVRELREDPEKETYDWYLGRTGEGAVEESFKSMKNDLELGEGLKGSVSLESG